MKVCQTINNRRHILTFAINTENSRWLKWNEIQKKFYENDSVCTEVRDQFFLVLKFRSI